MKRSNENEPLKIVLIYYNSIGYTYLIILASLPVTTEISERLFLIPKRL